MLESFYLCGGMQCGHVMYDNFRVRFINCGCEPRPNEGVMRTTPVVYKTIFYSQ